MGSDSRKRDPGEGREVAADTIERVMRERVRETIERIVAEELEAALGAARSARVGEARAGYRHGTRSRTLTTSLGPTTITMPRARLATDEGGMTEWASAAVPRYQRRTARVDEAILGVYLSGGNTRRLKGALAPLLRGGPLGKDAVSRLVGRLAADFETWRQRPLGTEDIRYLFGDGWYPCVRIGKRRERVPILVTLGVRASGERVVLDLRLVGQESAAGWRDAIDALVARGLRAPRARGGRRESRAPHGAAHAVARRRDSALHCPQAPQPPGEGAGAAAGGDRRGLPADDLRGDARGGREGARRLHEEVAPALRAGGREPRGGGGRALHLPALPGRAVEGAADDQRARAHQRGVSPPHEDAGTAAE